MADERTVMTVAILGGTGKEGSGLAMRWALKGYRVIIGSRDAQKAAQKAAELNGELKGDYLIGMDNASAASEAHVVVMTVPYSAHQQTLESVREQLEGKVLVDVTVPNPPKETAIHLPEGLAAALEAQQLVGDGVKVVSAFQHVGAKHLRNVEHPIDCDVLVCGDDAGAKADVLKLVEAAGMRGIDAGPLVNSIAVESLTPLLIYISKTYKVKEAGIRITGMA
jgi:8-hydroxy-5-deazaflavin:NADPH oxidoreductase